MNIFYSNNVLEYALCNGRSDNAAVISALRLVDDDEGEILRVVRREKSDEGRNVFTRRNRAVFILLRGARLARNAVTFNIGILPLPSLTTPSSMERSMDDACSLIVLFLRMGSLSSTTLPSEEMTLFNSRGT